MRIFEIASRSEFSRAFPVMRQLRTHLDEDTYFAALEEMIAGGYQLFARADDDGDIVALAGIGRGTNFYYGRYIWVYDLITRADLRSGGHGKALLDHIEQIARAEGRDTVALSSALHRTDAHRFYEERAGFERASYAFTKRLR